MTTTNLNDFGYRELDMAADLLKAWASGNLPPNFLEEDVKLMLNLNSGNVFLTNIEYQVVMMNDNKMEEYYITPFECHEGFLDELQEDYKQNPENWCEEDIYFLESLEKN